MREAPHVPHLARADPLGDRGARAELRDAPDAGRIRDRRPAHRGQQAPRRLREADQLRARAVQAHSRQAGCGRDGLLPIVSGHQGAGRQPAEHGAELRAPALHGGSAEPRHALKKQSLSVKQGSAKAQLYRQMAIAMQEQIKRRAEMAKTIDSTNTKIKGLLSDSTKLAGKPGKEKRVSELEAQAADLQERVAQQKELYDQVTRTLAWEWDKYNASKNRDMLAALQNHAFASAEFMGKQHELWGGIAAGVVSRVNKVNSEAAMLAGAYNPNTNTMSAATANHKSLAAAAPAVPAPTPPPSLSPPAQSPSSPTMARAPSLQEVSGESGTFSSSEGAFGSAETATPTQPNPFAGSSNSYFTG
ncbi:hypothetical protein Ctob_012057 [Chrysochromulina tobinii]|uniref:Uncharacterized protein n=1 Tax=Chrysochromulina tobinii TaxID=1460289 RepID=A0A0M0JH14_9EUKA|nr:hypothetical protein Ctob_012057 [Chrysochromulina tobinii]|eukprot:KOO25874.1 hypothetical protein Ctob_012057 [Chrysochromulina sp. CCMP291]